MFKDITIGQYFPGESIVHRFDPRLKIITMIFFIISLFFINTFIPYIFVAIYLLVIIKIANLPLKVVLKGLKPLRWILLITFVINIFFLPGEPLLKLGFLTISKEGLKTACLMAIRLMFLVLGTSLLTYTTSPIELTDGIEALLKPMKKIGVPSHEIAMMMTIALRFIPTLIEETDKIMKAQMARGADFESGNIIKRSKNLVPLLVPLFVNSFRRADELATAMEARCYRGGVGRTKMKVLVLEKYDYAIFLGNIVFFLILILATRL
ncbi:energy-coupling factor transporter transmembrane component T family protein [Peptoniphilus lacrimalis]|uniref:Energy-coupling factor transporter transmembrane protein EcfT n=1 Tax=Peptoniphilus lacrimalis 315-B TaxID=596330 RepID=D1VSK2_9FIRM|nr:energy-coupling factor transporter transmembrane component T [Peptoniphilus lacrimalis]EFA90618.1 cobalt transport protein [Peptoniphilus lacrimalis 315-B]